MLVHHPLLLQVCGSADDPIIKLCDLGVAKRRTDAPQYGPVSGTKEWQVGWSSNHVFSQADWLCGWFLAAQDPFIHCCV
jgi:hypothetical protein